MGLKPLKFDLFGTIISVEKSKSGWTAFYLGNEGKKRPAHDILIPPDMTESEIGQYLSDLCHEWATDIHPVVKRLA